MVSNPFKEERQCRERIDQILKNLIKKEIDEIHYKSLVKQCLVNFAVSRNMVENFIEDFYIDTGDIENKDGVLKKGANKK